MNAHSAADAYRDWLDTLDFDPEGYVTAIIQDRQTRNILTLSRMNRESLERTLSTGRAWLFSKQQRRLWHRSCEGAAFRPVVEILRSDDGCSLVFYVDRVAAPSPDTVRFTSALVRADEGGADASDLTDNAAIVAAMNQVFLIVAERLRVLPVGLTHTFRRLRSMLRDAERSAQIDRIRLSNSLATLIAQLLIFAAARGVAWNELLVTVQEQLVAQALTQSGGGLSEECR